MRDVSGSPLQIRSRMRVAVAQFGVGPDVDANLRTCLRMLDQAAAERPDLVVLPEFCNHASWYESGDHCQAVALEPQGAFLNAIAARAKALGIWVVINCTLRRSASRCTGTSLLFDDAGTLRGENDKQVLMGHENDHLSPAERPGPIVDTPFGRVGLYACMDGVINETPRCLALRGAQLMCNSLNSFAKDEGSLHVPVRAAENKVFVAAANKVGPLIPEAILGQVSRRTGIPERYLMGAGESQIVAPDGAVLAIASRDQPGVVCADIDLREADCKQRPDGSDIFALRRPQLYGALAQDPAGQAFSGGGAESVRGALIQLPETGPQALAAAVEAARAAFRDGAQLAALPPLFCLPNQAVDDPSAAAAASAAAVEALAGACGAGTYIATTLVARDPIQLCGILIGSHGMALRQGQLHASQRHAWSGLSERVEVADLGYARVAVLTSDDACVPETFRLATLAGADTVVVPAMPQERWEMDTGLLERSAENRVNLLVAAQPGALGASFATALPKDFTLRTQWEKRPFDGWLSHPPRTHAGPGPGTTPVEIHPRWAENKVVSLGTDLLAGRPWQLLDPICREDLRA